MKKNLRKIGFILALGTVSFSMTNCGGMTEEEAAKAAEEMEAKLNGIADEAANAIEAEVEEAKDAAHDATEEHKCEEGKCEDGAVEGAAEHVEEAAEGAAEHVEEAAHEAAGH